MSRKNFAVEAGYDVYAENGDLLASMLAGSAAPGGDAGPQDDAPIGSVYQRTDGNFYRKITDTNAASDWDLMPPGLLSSGYTPANGDPAIGDTLEEAFQKLDANQDDIQAASGLSQGDVDYGTFTGNIIPDSSTSKAALQALETEVESISGGAQVQVTGITTITDVDTFLVDDCQQIEWEVVVFEEATPANKKASKIVAIHDGSAGADAVNVDDSEFAKLRLGANFNLALSVDISGVGVAQEIRLRASSSTAGVTVTARRTIVS